MRRYLKTKAQRRLNEDAAIPIGRSADLISYIFIFLSKKITNGFLKTILD